MQGRGKRNIFFEGVVFLSKIDFPSTPKHIKTPMKNTCEKNSAKNTLFGKLLVSFDQKNGCCNILKQSMII